LAGFPKCGCLFDNRLSDGHVVEFMETWSL
jgi:hypothetical protein